MSYFTADFIGKNSLNYPAYLNEFIGKNSLCTAIAESDFIGINTLYDSFSGEYIGINNLVGAPTKFMAEYIGRNHLLAISGTSGSGLVYGGYVFDATYGV